MFCDKFTYYTYIKYLLPWRNAMKKICKKHAVVFNLWTCVSYVKRNESFMFASDYMFSAEFRLE